MEQGCTLLFSVSKWDLCNRHNNVSTTCTPHLLQTFWPVLKPINKQQICFVLTVVSFSEGENLDLLAPSWLMMMFWLLCYDSNERQWQGYHNLKETCMDCGASVVYELTCLPTSFSHSSIKCVIIEPIGINKADQWAMPQRGCSSRIVWDLRVKLISGSLSSLIPTEFSNPNSRRLWYFLQGQQQRWPQVDFHFCFHDVVLITVTFSIKISFDRFQVFTGTQVPE